MDMNTGLSTTPGAPVFTSHDIEDLPIEELPIGITDGDIEAVITELAVEAGDIPGTYGSQQRYSDLGLKGNSYSVLKGKIESIRRHMSNGGAGTVAVGMELVNARQMFTDEGGFKKLVKEEFGWSRSQAYNYVDAANLVDHRKLHVLHQSSLFVLGAFVRADKAAAEKVIAEVEKLLLSGPVKHKDVLALINAEKGTAPVSKGLATPAVFPPKTLALAKQVVTKHGLKRAGLLVEALKAEIAAATKAEREARRSATKATKKGRHATGPAAT